MAGFNDANTQYLLRTSLWSRQIKELLLDELNAMKFVRIISDLKREVCKTISLYAGNSLEPAPLLRKSAQDWTISRKGTYERHGYCMASWDNGRGRNLRYLSPEDQYQGCHKRAA